MRGVRESTASASAPPLRRRGVLEGVGRFLCASGRPDKDGHGVCPPGVQLTQVCALLDPEDLAVLVFPGVDQRSQLAAGVQEDGDRGGSTGLRIVRVEDGHLDLSAGGNRECRGVFRPGNTKRERRFSKRICRPFGCESAILYK